jgi:thiamine-phosphate diphosphorylase
VIRLPAPCLYLVTDRRLVAPGARTIAAELRALEAWIDRAVGAGVDVVQIRERDLDAARLADLAAAVRVRARGTRTRVLVNDRADVALAARADGVHVRADGPALARVRALGPRRWIIGRSVHSLTEVRSHQSADYLLFGMVFPSATKGRGAPAQGLPALRRAAAASRTPVLAIGGMTVARARAAIAAGAAGVAAIGLFLPAGRVPGALGPARAVAALRRVVLPRGHI